MVHETKLTIRLPKPLKTKINRDAKRRFISAADVAREALLNYFSDVPTAPKAVAQPQPEPAAA